MNGLPRAATAREAKESKRENERLLHSERKCRTVPLYKRQHALNDHQSSLHVPDMPTMSCLSSANFFTHQLAFEHFSILGRRVTNEQNGPILSQRRSARESIFCTDTRMVNPSAETNDAVSELLPVVLGCAFCSGRVSLAASRAATHHEKHFVMFQTCTHSF